MTENSDQISDVKEEINKIKLTLESIDKKKKKSLNSKILPEDFDYSIFDNFIIKYFNGEIVVEGEQPKKFIKLNSFYNYFKQYNPDFHIKYMRYHFEKRCKKLCNNDVVFFSLKNELL